uniref:Gram domain containing protein n=1 Tax=Echinococcus granulosus TaxID=6210 RepID=A0A068W7Q6_ECHGR|nr:gram domain containing protein [Echinococcus granulosus]
MNTSDFDLSSDPVPLRVNVSVDSGQPRVSHSLLISRPCDSISIPSLSSFLSVDSGKTTSAGGLSPCCSSPILVTQNTSFSDTERDTRTVDSGLPGIYGDADDGELDEIDEDEIGSNASDLFSSSLNLMPNPSSNDESVEAGCDFQSIRTFEASASVISKCSADGNSRNVYSLKKSRNGSKRKISTWYQVKRETLVKSYRAKVNHFKKIFDGTPVDTDRLLVDYSCALAKNKNGLLLLGRMYITEKWICFYSKIIYEIKLHIAVDNVQTVSKAKTARLIPNAIQITLKSNNERYFFTSFASRERTFAILKKVCENSRNGGGLLPSGSEVANMEELLCQVQDVYGDESLAVLDFEDGDDLDDDAHLTNRGRRVAHSPVWNKGPVSSTLPSPRSDSPNVQMPPRRLQRPSTDDEAPLSPRALVPQLCSSAHVGLASRSFSTYEMSESDTTATSDDDLADRSRGGIKATFRERAREPGESRRLLRKANRTPLPPQELTTAEVTHHRDGTQLHDNTSTIDNDYEEEQLQPVSCGTGHKHPGRIYADTDINVSVDALFACLFTDSQFFANFCAHRGTFDVEQSRWPPKPWPTPTTGDAILHRKISYVLTLKQRLGPRTCRAFESQTILLRETRPGMRYVVDATVTNEAVPLCNSFHVTTRYCLLRRSTIVSHLLITSEVIYDRPVFFGAKSIIDSTCRSNLTDNFTDLVSHLSAAVERLSDRDRITGGALSRPHRSRITRSHLKIEGGGSGSEEVDGVESTSISGSGTGVQQIARGLSIPQVLLYSNQQTDRKWFFVVALSLGLCVFLSMVYNRYQRVGQTPSDHLEFTTRTSRSGSSCCDELTSVRLLIESVSGVLAQMRTTLDLLERRRLLWKLGGLLRYHLCLRPSKRCTAFIASAATVVSPHLSSVALRFPHLFYVIISLHCFFPHYKLMPTEMIWYVLCSSVIYPRFLSKSIIFKSTFFKYKARISIFFGNSISTG